jgi:hypothetical protein
MRQLKVLFIKNFEILELYFRFSNKVVDQVQWLRAAISPSFTLVLFGSSGGLFQPFLATVRQNHRIPFSSLLILLNSRTVSNRAVRSKASHVLIFESSQASIP